MTEFERLPRRPESHIPVVAAARSYSDTPAQAIDLTMVGNRSLSERDAWRIVMVIGAVLSLGALRALVLGAWPIAAVMVADALLFGAMMIGFVRRPPPRERLMIRDGLIRLEQSWPGGARVEAGTFGARLETSEASTGEMHLHLKFAGRRLGIATMLSPDERREVADVVKRALRDCA